MINQLRKNAHNTYSAGIAPMRLLAATFIYFLKYFVSVNKNKAHTFFEIRFYISCQQIYPVRLVFLPVVGIQSQSITPILFALNTQYYCADNCHMTYVP